MSSTSSPHHSDHVAAPSPLDAASALSDADAAGQAAAVLAAQQGRTSTRDRDLLPAFVAERVPQNLIRRVDANPYRVWLGMIVLALCLTVGLSITLAASEQFATRVATLVGGFFTVGGWAYWSTFDPSAASVSAEIRQKLIGTPARRAHIVFRVHVAVKTSLVIFVFLYAWILPYRWWAFVVCVATVVELGFAAWCTSAFLVMDVAQTGLGHLFLSLAQPESSWISPNPSFNITASHITVAAASTITSFATKTVTVIFPADTFTSTVTTPIMATPAF
ncbi:uncharacterized protein JCM10292_005246 [Rhodotorula paludigena]|uniref:uncharacterized protein n=1 Tax=Rhodotorula paludigena TaxID=86838 RepID=UPI0031723A03